MAEDPIKAIGFDRATGKVSTLKPLKPLGSGKAVGFDQVETTPNPVEGPTPSPQYTEGYLPGTALNDHLAQQQDGWDQFGNFVAQTGIEALAGTVEAGSYLLDFQQHLDKIRGEEQNYSNWLADQMKQAKEEGRTEWVPVYTREENEGFNPSSAEWWAANGGQGLGSTLSLLIPGMGVAKLGKVAGLGTLGQTISATLASRYAESTMEANQIYDELVNSGASKEQAGNAASKAWNSNWIFALQDFAQFNAITKGFSALSKGAKGSGFGQLLKQIASEGAEEAGQYVVSEEAKRTALNADVDYFGKDFSKRLVDYIDDDEFKTSTLLGALGGGVFHAAGTIADRLIDVQQGDLIPKAKERLQKIFSRGLQKEVANAIDDKVTSQQVTNIDFAQQFLDNFNKGRLPAYKGELEELKKRTDLDPEARKSIDTHIEDIDFLMTEEAKLRNSSIPTELHKPILLKKLELNQTFNLAKQTESELDKVLQEATQKDLNPAMLDLKKAKAIADAYKVFAILNPGFSEKAEQFNRLYQDLLVSTVGPDGDAKLATQFDDKINKLTYQGISINEKKAALQNELAELSTPEGIEKFKNAQAVKQAEDQAKAILSNPNATKEQLEEAMKLAVDPVTEDAVSKRIQALIDKDKQGNIDQLHDVVESTVPEMVEPVTEMMPEDVGPQDMLPPDLDPNMELMPDDLTPDMIEPEVDFAGGISQEQANRWGLSSKETEELVSKLDVETREPKPQTTEAKEKQIKTKEDIQSKTAVSTTSLNSGSRGDITYHNNITGDIARPEDIFAVDPVTRQLLVNTPKILPGQVVTLKVENDFPWTQQEGFKPTSEENYTINVYVEGVQKPITQLRNADNKYLTKEEKESNKKLRSLILSSPNQSLTTTIASKNIGTPRTDNVLRSVEVLESDFVLQKDGTWQMQVLPHNPVFGLIDHNGTIHTLNIGTMRAISFNTGIVDRIEEAVQKYVTATDLRKLSGKTIAFRTAPDGTLRALGQEYRVMSDAERGWVRNNLVNLINAQNYTALKEVMYIPQHPSGIYKHTDDKGRPKRPDVTKLDRFRFHIVSTSPTTTDFLIPILGKGKQKLWIVVENTNLSNLLNNREFTYRIIDSTGNKSPFRTDGRERIVEAFDKILAKQFKNINEENLNSEIQYTDPVTQQVYPTFYDYLVKTSTLQTKLKGSITVGSGEDSSYSFNQVSLYLDPNPSKVTTQVKDEIILTVEDETKPEPAEDKSKSTKAPKDLLSEYFDQDEPMLKPASTEGHTFNLITEKELQWFKDHIGEQYLAIAKNVDKFIAANGVEAFGQYYNSLVTLADYAPMGTAYHEAGHFLFDPKNGLVTKNEKEKILDEGSKVYGIKRSHDESNKPKLKAVDYKLRAMEILQSTKAEEMFKKGEKNKWDLNKILTELAVPKEQKELLLGIAPTIPDTRSSYEQDDHGDYVEYPRKTNLREELVTELASRYSYVVEIETQQEPIETISRNEGRDQFDDEELIAMGVDPNQTPEAWQNTQHYSRLTVPGGTNYTENEVKTPGITPNKKGHAEFSTDNGIGWFRSDEKAVGGKYVTMPDMDLQFDENGNPLPMGTYTTAQEKGTPTKTRRILELQSDLFQKKRDKKVIVRRGGTQQSFIDRNNFLQLLNKDNAWVSFFVKSIVQDSAGKGYEKVLFPTGNTANKVEGQTTVEEYIKTKTERLDILKADIKDLEENAVSFIRQELEDKGIYYEFTDENGNKAALIAGEATGPKVKRDEKVYKYSHSKGMEYITEKEFANKYKEVYSKKVITEIEQLESEIRNAENGTASFAAIHKFYETTVSNILKKTYGQDNIKRVKDEYGNEWYELTLKEEHKGQIKLKAVSEVEQTGDYMIEEKIMEAFEAYKLSDGKVKPPVVAAKGFFRRLLQMVKNLLGFKSPIERLFAKFDKARPQDINVNPNLDDIAEPKFRLLPGFWNAAHQKEAVQSFASEVMRIANEASREQGIDLIDLFTRKKNIDVIFDSVKGKFAEDYTRIASVPIEERTKGDSLRYFSYLAMGIGNSTVPNESVLNGSYEDIKREGLNPLEGFKTRVLKDLARWGFRVRLEDGTTYEERQTTEESVELQDIATDEGYDNSERLYGIDSTQINPSDSMSQRVRLFLSTIPEPVIDTSGRPTSKNKVTIFGTPKYIDFKKVDAALTLKLVNCIDPLTRLNTLSNSDPISKVVLDRLMDEKNKGNDQVYTEFFVKYRRDSYSKKSVLLEKERVWIRPENRVGGMEYEVKHTSKLIDTDRNSVDRVLLNKWREEAVRKQVIETDGTVIHRKATALSNELAEFKTKFIDAKVSKNNLPYEEVKNKLAALLKVLGVDIPVQLWDELESLKPGEKYTVIQDWTFGLRKHSLEDLVSKYVDGIDPFSGSNIISDLAEKSVAYVEDLSRGAYLNESGDQEYPNNTPSYITEFINNSKENPQDVISMFQQDEFYAGNAFLGVISDKARRSNLELKFTSSIRVGESDPKDFQSRSEIESLVMRFTEYHNNAGDSAYYNVGTPADKTKQPMLSLPKYKGSRAKDFLLSVLNNNINNEVVRIQRLKGYINSIRKDQPLPTDIANLKDNAKFKYIDELNTIPELTLSVSDGSISPAQFKEARDKAHKVLDKFVMDEYELFLKFLEDNDLIKTARNNENVLEVASVTNKMPEGILYDHKGIKAYTPEAFLKEFFYNDLAWRFEVSKVFQGDIALYKSQDDYFKRQYQLVTPGYKPLTENESVLTRGVYGKQFKLNTEEYLISLAQLVKEGATKSDNIYKEIAKYGVVNKTDAQSLMTIDAYRTMAKALGQWTKDHEIVYNFAWKKGMPIRRAVKEALGNGSITEDQATTYKMLALKVLLQPFKPFVFRDVVITLPDGKKMIIKEQVKDSITVITPEMSTVSKGYSDLLAYMYSNSIDIMSAEDTVKVGSYGVINDFSAPAASWQKRKINLSDFKFPQFIPDKKKEEVSGTQMHKLILGNVDDKEIIKKYNNLWAEKIEKASSNLKKRLGLTAQGLKLSDSPSKRTDQLFKLHLLLKQELGGRDLNENYHDILDLIKRGTEQTDFTLPLSFPAFGPKFQSILTNLWKKEVIKQKSPGYSAVNLADFGVGYSDELKFITNEGGQIVEAEIGLPIEYVSKVGIRYGEHILPNGTILWDKLNENQKKSLQYILYRIPTSNKSSMVPVRVVRVTPAHLNNIVMIPGELTIQQGLDFDVDKSQLIGRVLDNEGKIDNGDVDTKLFNLYWDILTDKKYALELLTPLASPTMEAKLNEFRKNGVIESVERSSPLSTTSDVQAEVRNKDGQAEIGIASRFNTGHTVIQTIRDYVGVKAGINLIYKGQTFTTIGGKVASDGSLISTNHAESQQAALDAAKNPLLAYFNVVKGTMAAFHTMIEFGIPLPVTIDFFMQPVIKEWTKFYKHEGQNVTKATEKLFTTYPSIRAQFDQMKKDKPDLHVEQLTKYINLPLTESNEHSARVLHEFLNVMDLSNQLSNINNVISVDTFADATGLESLQSFLAQRDEATNQDAKIYIDPRVFSTESTPAEGKRLASFFKHGIEDAMEYISQFYPSASSEYAQMRDYYAQVTGEESITDKKLVRKLNQFSDYFAMQYDSSLFRTLTQNHPLYNADPKLDKSDYRHRWSFFDPNKSIWKYINSLQDAKASDGKLLYPSLQKNALIKNLETEESRQNEVQIIGVRNTDAQSDKTDYINAWWDLFNAQEESLRVLAHDLIRYSIQTSGFQFSIRSFYDLIPVQYWVQSGVGNLWDGIVKNPKLDNESAIVNFIRSNFRSLDRFPEVYTRFVGGQIQSDMILNVKQTGKHLKEFNVKESYREGLNLPRFVRVYDWDLDNYRLYESDPKDVRHFKEVQPQGSRNFTEIFADRQPSNSSKVRSDYRDVSPDPWKGIKREYNLFNNSTPGSNIWVDKYIPNGRTDAKTVLNLLIANEVDIKAKEILNVMLKHVDKLKAPVVATLFKNQDGVAGKFAYNKLSDGEIYSVLMINSNGLIESEAEMRYVLLHELIHGYSISILDNPSTEQEKNFVRNITRIYKGLNASKPELRSEYGMYNIQEFLAELGSNKTFRSKVRGVESLWSRILRAFRNLFGVKNEFDKIFDEWYSVLDNVEDLQNLDPAVFNLQREQKEIKGSKRISVLQQALSSLQAREKELRRRWKKEEANELQKERKILENLVATNRNQAVVRYLLHTEKEMSHLQNIYNSLIKDPKKINPEALNSMRDQLISYDTIHTLSDAIYSNPTEFIPEGGDVDSMLKQLNQLSSDISRLLKRVERLGVKRFAAFIKEAIADTRSIEEIEDNLTVADKDIVWSSRWTDPGLDIEDPAVKAIAMRLKENSSQAYRKIQEDLYNSVPVDKEVEVVTLHPTWDGLREYWKKTKVKFKSIGFLPALEQYEVWLKKNRPKSDTFADKFAPIISSISKGENSDGVHFISPFSAEGKAILAIKEGSQDYPLRQFYETVVLGYLKSQEEISEYSLRPGLRIPSIGRGLMEGYLREKGLKNTAGVFKEQLLNNFRERYDDADYQPVDQSGRPRQGVALRFTSKHDGNDGRLTTREVSLDIANTVPLFVHEMYLRKGLIGLKDDLEIGKSVLAQRRVLKTKRTEGKGLTPFLTGNRENITLSSGEFDYIHGRESKSYEAYDSLVRRFLYGQIKAREGDVKIGNFKASLSKAFDFLLRATGAKLMLFNVAIPLTNYVATEFTFIKEVVGGNIISKTNWLAGQKLYGEAALAGLQDLTKREKKTEFGRIFTYFNPMDTERPVESLGIDSNWMRTTLHKVASSGSDLFEYKLAVNAMGAVMDRFRVTDPEGKEVSMYKGLEVTNDGKVTLKKGYQYKGKSTLDSKTIDDIIQYSLRLYQSATGIRNRMDQTSASEYVVGRAVEFMRKWLKPGLNARFKTRHFDEKIKHENEGHYVSSLILYNNIFGRSGWVKNMTDALKVLVFMNEEDPKLLLLPEELAFSEDRQAEIINLRQANIRKTAFELYAIMAMSMLLWFGWDDDKDEDSYLKFMTARVRRELMTFIDPSTAWDVLRSPTVALNTIEGFQRIGSSMVEGMGAAINDEDQPVYMSGPYKEQEKIWADLERQFIPFRKQFSDIDTKTRLIIKGYR